MKPILSLWNRYYQTVKPILDRMISMTRKLASDPMFRRTTLATILLRFQLVAFGLQLSLIMVFIFQCIRVWSTRCSLAATIDLIDDDNTRKQLNKIENGIITMKDIAWQLDELIVKYENDNDESNEQFWNQKLTEMKQITLSSINRHTEISKLINEQKLHLEHQQINLEKCDHRFESTGLGLLSTSGIGLLTTLIHDKMSQIEHTLRNLVDYDMDLNRMDQVIKHLEQRFDLVDQQMKIKKNSLTNEKKINFGILSFKNSIVNNLVNVTDGWRSIANSYLKIGEIVAAPSISGQ